MVLPSSLPGRRTLHFRHFADFCSIYVTSHIPFGAMVTKNDFAPADVALETSYNENCDGLHLTADTVEAFALYSDGI